MTDHPAIERGLGPEAGADLAGAALGCSPGGSRPGATMWCVAPEPRSTRATSRWSSCTRSSSARGRSRPWPSTTAIRWPRCVPSARPGDILSWWSTAVGAGGVGRHACGRRRGASPASGSAAGTRARRGAADHVLWVDGPTASAAYDGRLVLAYHLLWELTHVCFEHPGLLVADDRRRATTRSCITCSDEGRLAEVVEVDVTATAWCAPPWASSRSTSTSSAPSVPATSCSSTPAPPSPSSSGAAVTRTDFLYPFIEGDERDAERAARRPRPLGRGQGRGQRRTATRDARPRRRRRSTRAAVAMAAAVRRTVGGCSPSATAAARPTRRRSRRCSPARRRARRCRPAASPTTPRCSPRWPTTSASTSCSPAS